jgi:hypothetical protein
MLSQITKSPQKQLPKTSQSLPDNLKESFNNEWHVLCKECGRDVYRALSHKRIKLFKDTDVNSPVDSSELNEFLKSHSWHDIHHVSFTTCYVDVVYLNEVIYPRKESTSKSFLEDIKDEAPQTGESQPSLL